MVVKVYIDANLISDPSKINNFEQGEIKALENLSILHDKSLIEFYTSKKTKEEIEKYKNETKRSYLQFICSLVRKIPEKNIIKFIPATFNSVMFNEATFNGDAEREDILFSELKKIFDKDDAEHIFQAEKNGLEYFLTLDKKTILQRYEQTQEQLRKVGLKIKIVSPRQLMQELTKTNYTHLSN